MHVPENSIHRIIAKGKVVFTRGVTLGHPAGQHVDHLRDRRAKLARRSLHLDHRQRMAIACGGDVAKLTDRHRFFVAFRFRARFVLDFLNSKSTWDGERCSLLRNLSTCRR